jgi:hypothetical protein
MSENSMLLSSNIRKSPLAPLKSYGVYNTSPVELIRRSRSPLAPLKKGGTGLEVPLKKGGTGLEVPLKKGDLGGSPPIPLLTRDVYTR